MTIVNVVIAASLGESVAPGDWLGPAISGLPVLVLHSSNKLGELLQL